MSLYIPKMSDTPAITIPGLASNFQALDGSRIVEWGSNENGEYIRWENGLQICFGINIVCDNVETSTRLIRGSWVYPAPFITSAVFLSYTSPFGAVSYTPASLRFRPLIPNYTTPSSTIGTIAFRLADGGEINESYSLEVTRVIAIGRWK